MGGMGIGGMGMGGMGGLPIDGLHGLFTPPYVLPASLQTPPGQLPSTAAFLTEQIEWLQQQLLLLHPTAAAASSSTAAAHGPSGECSPTTPQRSGCCSGGCCSGGFASGAASAASTPAPTPASASAAESSPQPTVGGAAGDEPGSPSTETLRRRRLERLSAGQPSADVD